ncbi:MAG: hypothetical protein AAF677_18695, partial [Pseudomonadota bacterium]
ALTDAAVVLERVALSAASFGPAPPYAGVSAVETFEHLPHAPKPLIDRIMAVLARVGALSRCRRPTSGRIGNRRRMPVAKSPMGKGPCSYRHSTPFFGHHREIRPDALRFTAAEMGLAEAAVFSTEFRDDRAPD